MVFKNNYSAKLKQPLKVALAGLSHDHVEGVLERLAQEDVLVVGIAEGNKELVQRYRRSYQLPESLFYKDLATLLEYEKPDVVMAYNAITEHMAVVEACAPLGVHVMVEKPLATTVKDAERMAALAREHQIHLLTNYETTWYPSNQELYIMVSHHIAVGDIRKMVVHDGNIGPKELGCSKEFLGWLTDPVKNGGGAIMDFGCYGANLMTWLMQGQEPLAVMAVTRQLKPEVYTDVDDDATIILEYPQATGIIEASWNWPYNIKDLEIFGQTGYLQAVNSDTLRSRKGADEDFTIDKIEPLAAPYQDYVSYFTAVVRGDIKPEHDLSSLKNNLTVVKILEAARESARKGKRVVLGK
ncbi:gfo/Idh/MocA family oxidoreductase [Pontibacter diazotrophicus]|uniref:Gfo/Idh/MocA family oxidoreductase n=1 Tax=Pontibacter diazotrophicus TaxID=1400979 RepID=A0A3D8L791_9BACT|nr:Gfo/Idh/MocA family oxidoreductase [Pontibacter diazotrophicus]RDV13271.1 gfo/Idh/MocA family oxidoreductase [Pontibacter diazotrophicus]